MTKREIIKLRRENFCQWCWRARFPDSCGLLKQLQEYAVMTDGCPFNQYKPDLKDSKALVQAHWNIIRKKGDRTKKEKHKKQSSPGLTRDDFFKLMGD